MYFTARFRLSCLVRITGLIVCDRSICAGPLPEEAYVWQRTWNDSVRESISQHGTNFAGLAALGAEVTWKHGELEAVRIPVDYAALLDAKVPIGLTLRIGPYPGPFRTNGLPIAQLCGLARSMISDANSKHLEVSELQVDF